MKNELNLPETESEVAWDELVIPDSRLGVMVLGRYGDIINLLPCFKWMHDHYCTPTVLVSSQFADIFTGVSYINPLPIPIWYTRAKAVMERMAYKFKIFINAQVCIGDGHSIPHFCPSFNMEAWRLCGLLHRFHDFTLRPVFDRRNLQREEQLFRQVVPKPNSPYLVLELRSYSSPLDNDTAEKIRKLVKDICKRNDIQVVYMEHVGASRIYDLLTLLERAAGIISVDTALLHLCAATNTPVIALSRGENAHSWGGTILRTPNVLARIPYGELRESFHIIRDALGRLFPIQYRDERRQVIYHLALGENNMSAVAESWNQIYAQGVLPLHHHASTPTTLNEMIRPAFNQAADNDIILLAKETAILNESVIETARFAANVYDAATFRDANNQITGFAFRAAWIREHLHAAGDFLYGFAKWDWALALVIRSYHANLKDNPHLSWNIIDISRPFFPSDISTQSITLLPTCDLNTLLHYASGTKANEERWAAMEKQWTSLSANEHANTHTCV